MTETILFFFVQAARIGFIFSLLTHLATFRNMNLQEEFPVVWWLHFGVFFVWIPTVLLGFQIARLSGWKRIVTILKNNTPMWLGVLLMLFLLYASYHFYIMTNTVNPANIQATQNSMVRGYSAHWPAFYLLSLTFLRAVKKDLIDEKD